MVGGESNLNLVVYTDWRSGNFQEITEDNHLHVKYDRITIHDSFLHLVSC